MAMAKAYTEAREGHAGSELIGEIAASAPSIGSKEFSSAEDLRTRGLGKITEAVALLESKATPEEVEAAVSHLRKTVLIECLNVPREAAERL